MTPARFALRRATDWEELPALLAQPGAMPVAGAQSLMPMLALRMTEPALLVALGDLPGLQRVEQTAAALVIGAGVTHAATEDGIGPEPLRGWLAHVASGIAYRPVRNRGTVGGSLALHDPAADWPVALLALDAVAVLRRGAIKRRMALAQFLTGAFATALGSGEVLEAIEIPTPPPGARFGWCKIAPAPGAFAEAATAVLLRPGAAPRIAVTTHDGARLLTAAPRPDDPYLARLREVAIRRAEAAAA
ncbi:FAD binding domain-containing protein [Falsiroseomonas oryziterrae]|uniref:FAD binding domain-containing protein n=1 Tax=Falsiroseomonas oryziterrae TaxID=2911368 RepID=UPI001F400FBA|nr:FAD binding domain-containing protein [Roseomonas sp. NPKOSM-4]